MKFAFLIIGNFNFEEDRVSFHNGQAQMIGVADIQQACCVAKKLALSGIDCIELCGAFGPAGARKVMEATKNKIPIGYITHLPEQDQLYNTTFLNKKNFPLQGDG